MTHSGCAHEVALLSSTVELAPDEEVISEKQAESDLLHVGELIFALKLVEATIEVVEVMTESLRLLFVTREGDKLLRRRVGEGEALLDDEDDKDEAEEDDDEEEGLRGSGAPRVKVARGGDVDGFIALLAMFDVKWSCCS